MTHDDTDRLVADYRRFAETEAAGSSPSYERWARHVAATRDLADRLATLPRGRQQPNLVLAAARALGAVPGDPASLEALVAGRWPELTGLVARRTTQTNEVGRCAALLPVLASLPQPLALVEVGAAAGLCLLPDRYSYRYETPAGTRWVDPPGGRSPVVLPCRTGAGTPVPSGVPRVAWRAGLDLRPVDVTDGDEVAWLEALVWPEQQERRDRLRAALGLARLQPPRVVRGDLREALPALASQAPAGATLVVMHSASLAYVDDAEERAAFVRTVRGLPGHWVSNEGRRVLDVPVPASAGPATPDTLFTVALDGVAVALGHGHGAALTWLD